MLELLLYCPSPSIQIRENNIVALDLSNRGLSSLPLSIKKFTALESLNLYGNNLTQFPSNFNELPQLKDLNCEDNPWTNFFAHYLSTDTYPSTIAGFRELQSFIPKLCEKIQNNIELLDIERQFPFFAQYREMLVSVCDTYPTKTAGEVRILLEAAGSIQQGNYNVLL
jgi:Leucine-rich repeat (LRR) protein